MEWQKFTQYLKISYLPQISGNSGVFPFLDGEAAVIEGVLE